MVRLNKKTQLSVQEKFETIISEQSGNEESAPLMIATILMQMLVEVCRSIPQDENVQEPGTKNAILRDFQLLIERHFVQMKLPNEYAALLFITPHQLNAVCKEGLGIAAGEVIRNRVLLEAKRLLINFDLPIGEISDRLNFPDHSYFVKFFKKYTSITPEAFRRSNYK